MTAPEVGGLYGACVARQIDRTWRLLGSPDPFLVVEAGAGQRPSRPRGPRAPLRDCAPRCGTCSSSGGPSLRSQRARATCRSNRPTRRSVRSPCGRADEELAPVHAAGPVFAVATRNLPEMPVDAFVFANELLRQPAVRHCGVATANRWNEVRVALGRLTAFVELLVPASPTRTSAMLTANRVRPTNAAILGPATRVPTPPRASMRGSPSAAGSLHSGRRRRSSTSSSDFGEFVHARSGTGCARTASRSRAGDALDAARSARTSRATSCASRWRTLAGCHRGSPSPSDRVAEPSGSTSSPASTSSSPPVDSAWEDGRRARRRFAAVAGRSRVHEGARRSSDPAGLGAHRVVTLVRRDGAGGEHQ